MMIKKAFTIFLATSIIAILIGGCSTDEENPVTPTPPAQAPEFTLKQINLPQNLANSVNPMAKQVPAVIDQVLDFASCGCTFAAPGNAETLKAEGGEWEYQWTIDQLTKKILITSVSGRDTWKIFYDGSLDGHTLTNWRFMDAVQNSTLSNGHVTLFKIGTITPELEWVWYTLENTDYKLIKQSFGDSPIKIEITIRTDNSGIIDKYKHNSQGVMAYDAKFSWKMDGSGSYWTFEDGIQTSYGTWP